MTDLPSQARQKRRKLFGTFPTPQWAEWNEIRSAYLWELVALAVDIEPSALTTWNTFNPAVVPPLRFHSLLRRAKAAIEDPKGVFSGTFKPVDDLALAVLPLGNFREWARIQSIPLPEFFPISPITTVEDFKTKRRLRLTLEISTERSMGTKDFMEVVAKREGITRSRLQQIVGTTADRARTLSEFQKTQDKSLRHNTTR